MFGQQQEEAAEGEEAHTDAYCSAHKRQQQVFNQNCFWICQGKAPTPAAWPLPKCGAACAPASTRLD